MKVFEQIRAQCRDQQGMEISIIKQLPYALLAGTLLPILFYLTVASFPTLLPLDSIDRTITAAWISSVVIILTVWTAVFTVAIGCVIVIVMKGPHHTADSYPLIDSETPKQKDRHNERIF